MRRGGLDGADVVVAEAFAGNVCLKTMEGVSSALIKKIKGALTSSLKTKIGALFIKKALKDTVKSFDTESYGGAPLLGCKGLLVKTHGSSSSRAFKNSLLQCIKFTDLEINEKIRQQLTVTEEN